MTAKYWIKLYHETLHDRKIATLDDRLWRRFIEMLLLAGENNKDGWLPSLTDIAWTLRIDIEQLETELNELVRIGVLECREGLYFVRNFQKRQDPMDKAEYMRRRRTEEQRQEHYQARYQPVTNGNTESDTDTDKIKTPPPAPAFIDAGQAQTIFQDITGMVTFPSKSRPDDIERICAIHKAQGNNTVVYCKTFFEEWLSRKYNRVNTSWLDWAVSGEIPKNSKNPKVPKENPAEVYG